MGKKHKDCHKGTKCSIKTFKLGVYTIGVFLGVGLAGVAVCYVIAPGFTTECLTSAVTVLKNIGVNSSENIITHGATATIFGGLTLYNVSKEAFSGLIAASKDLINLGAKLIKPGCSNKT